MTKTIIINQIRNVSDHLVLTRQMQCCPILPKGEFDRLNREEKELMNELDKLNSFLRNISMR